jgi:hypothetical protein
VSASRDGSHTPLLLLASQRNPVQLSSTILIRESRRSPTGVPSSNCNDGREFLDASRRDRRNGTGRTVSPPTATTGSRTSGTTLVKANFWSYIDVRDVGSAYRAALEGTSSGHEVCLIAAADTRAKRGLRELMAEYCDGYDRFASDYQDPRSAFDCAKMKALFGWTPSHSWRDH